VEVEKRKIIAKSTNKPFFNKQLEKRKEFRKTTKENSW